jgi:hypothetical protein
MNTKQIKLNKQQKEELADILTNAVHNCTDEIVPPNLKGIDLESEESEELVDVAYAIAEAPVIDEFIKLLESRKKLNAKRIASVVKRVTKKKR